MDEQPALNITETKESLPDFSRQLFSLSWDVLLYGIGGALLQVFSVITIPIMTHVLTEVSYGSYDLIVSTLDVMVLLATLGITQGMYRYYFDIPAENIQEKRRLVSTLLFFIVLVTGSLTALFYVLAPSLCEFLFDSQMQLTALRTAVLVVPMKILFTIFTGLQRLQRLPLRFLIFNLCLALLNFSLFLLFLLGLGLELDGVFLAQIISYVCLAITVGFSEKKFIGFSFSGDWLRKMFLYGIAQLPGMLMFWYITTSNRYFLSFFVDITHVAYYSVGYKVSIGLAMIYTAFVAAWEPFVLSKLDRPDIKTILKSVLKYYVIILLFLGAVFTIFAEEIMTIFVPASYLPGVPIVGIMVIRHILPGFATITSVGISIKKKPIIYTISLGIGVLASILANLTLTARWGIYGAAFSEVIGMGCWAASAFFMSRSLYPVDWDFSVVIKSIAGFVCLAFTTFLLFKSSLPLSLAIPIKLLVLALFTWFLVRFIEPEHRKLVFVTLPEVVYKKIRRKKQNNP